MTKFQPYTQTDHHLISALEGQSHQQISQVGLWSGCSTIIRVQSKQSRWQHTPQRCTSTENNAFRVAALVTHRNTLYTVKGEFYHPAYQLRGHRETNFWYIRLGLTVFNAELKSRNRNRALESGFSRCSRMSWVISIVASSVPLSWLYANCSGSKWSRACRSNSIRMSYSTHFITTEVSTMGL